MCATGSARNHRGRGRRKYHAGCKNDKTNMEVLSKKWLRRKVIMSTGVDQYIYFKF